MLPVGKHDRHHLTLLYTGLSTACHRRQARQATPNTALHRSVHRMPPVGKHDRQHLTLLNTGLSTACHRRQAGQATPNTALHRSVHRMPPVGKHDRQHLTLLYTGQYGVCSDTRTTQVNTLHATGSKKEHHTIVCLFHCLTSS